MAGLFTGVTDSQSPSGVAGAGARAMFQARLRQVNVFTIRVEPAVGLACEVNGEILYLTTAGISCLNTDLRILGSGLAAAAGPLADTTYYAYLSNSAATYAPRSLRLSGVQPTAGPDGALYLGATGNAANWRYVGLARTNSAIEFPDNERERFVASFYNRRPFPLFVCPGYVDDNANTLVSLPNGAGWLAWPTTARVEFVALGDDTIALEAQATFAASANAIGLGFRIGTDVQAGALAVSTTDGEQVSLRRNIQLARGFYAVDLCYKKATAAANCYVDFASDGADADVPATFLTGVIWR
jgi:hypothetical protein